MSAPVRFDRLSVRDVAALLTALAGFGLLRLGGWLMRAGDDALDVWTEHDE